MDNYFLNSINQTIGENMRFARSFQSQQQAGQTDGQLAGAGGDPFSSLLHPLMFMMLFQMWSQLSAQFGGMPQGNVFPAHWNMPVAPANPALDLLSGVLTDEDNPEEPVAQVKTHLSEGKYTQAQLGLALQHLMAQADGTAVEDIAWLAARLIDEQVLPASPFFRNAFIESLSDDRRQALVEAMADEGLQRADGKTNTALAGLLLHRLSGEAGERGNGFARELVTAYYDRVKDAPDSEEARLLASVLELAGVTVAEDQLVFG